MIFFNSLQWNMTRIFVTGMGKVCTYCVLHFFRLLFNFSSCVQICGTSVRHSAPVKTWLELLEASRTSQNSYCIIHHGTCGACNDAEHQLFDCGFDPTSKLLHSVYVGGI